MHLPRFLGRGSRIEALLNTVIAQGKKIMAQNDDLTNAVAALAASATAAEAAIQTELNVIANASGDNPAVTAAIQNIQTITAGLTAAANSVPSPQASAQTAKSGS